MPKYVYRCLVCKNSWEVQLSLQEAREFACVGCVVCGRQAVRVPQSFSVQGKEKETAKKVGDITEDFIGEAREELEEQKIGARNKEYKV